MKLTVITILIFYAFSCNEKPITFPSKPCLEFSNPKKRNINGVTVIGIDKNAIIVTNLEGDTLKKAVLNFIKNLNKREYTKYDAYILEIYEESSNFNCEIAHAMSETQFKEFYPRNQLLYHYQLLSGQIEFLDNIKTNKAVNIKTGEEQPY